MCNLDALLINRIEMRINQPDITGRWREGKFKKIKFLSNDARGRLGEEFLAEILTQLGCKVEHPRGPNRNERHWDLRVNGKTTLEVKTATIGTKVNTFQHENIDRNRNFDFLVLVDITPNEIYLTPASKSTIPFEEPNDIWTERSKSIHLRHNEVQYKWTLNLNDVSPRQVRTLEDAESVLQNIIRDIK